jgi:hypothetical protein
MDVEELARKQEILEALKSRLHERELQAAQYGASADPIIPTDTRKLKAQIKKIEREIKELEGSPSNLVAASTATTTPSGNYEPTSHDSQQVGAVVTPAQQHRRSYVSGVPDEILAMIRAQAATTSSERTVKGHGRLETYRVRATTALNAYLGAEYDWPDVGQVFCIEHTRVILSTGLLIRTLHYAITSLDPVAANAEDLLKMWHEHWHIENKSHWVRDVVFGEDASRARTGTLPEALALLRAAVISRLRLAGMDGITAARSQASADQQIAAFLVGIP